MKKIFNEAGISLVLGSGNWIGLSYEIEEGENEMRGLGWKKIELKNIKDVYFRLWLFNKVLIISKKDGFQLRSKNKYGLKMILGFSD